MYMYMYNIFSPSLSLFLSLSFPPSLPPFLPPSQAMGHDLQPSSVFTGTLDAVRSVHKVYMNMQDLFNKFQNEVLPDAINQVMMEDDSVVEMMEELCSFRLTSYPNLPLSDALSKLADELLQATLRVKFNRERGGIKFVAKILLGHPFV